MRGSRWTPAGAALCCSTCSLHAFLAAFPALPPALSCPARKLLPPAAMLAPSPCVRPLVGGARAVKPRVSWQATVARPGALCRRAVYGLRAPASRGTFVCAVPCPDSPVTVSPEVPVSPAFRPALHPAHGARACVSLWPWRVARQCTYACVHACCAEPLHESTADRPHVRPECRDTVGIAPFIVFLPLLHVHPVPTPGLSATRPCLYTSDLPARQPVPLHASWQPITAWPRRTMRPCPR